MIRTVSVALAAILAMSASQGKGTGVLTGTVVDDQGRAVPRARVGLVNNKFGVDRSTLTNEAGEFRLDGLAPGTFSLAASKSGYTDALFGRVLPGLPGIPINLTSGATTTVTVRLPRGGVISGVVRDGRDRPLPGAFVRVFRRAILQGRPGFESIGSARANSHGEFRVFGLGAGRYLVGATNESLSSGEIRQSDTDTDDAAIVSVPFYHPSTTSPATAREVRVTAGEETPNIDVTMTDVPAARLEGMIDNVTGAALSSSRAGWFDDASDPFGRSLQASATVDAGGHFVLLGVPEGRHIITVRANGRPSVAEPMGAGPFWAWAEVSTTGTPANVTMELRRGVTVSGKFAAADSASLPDLSRLSLLLAAQAGPFAREVNVTAQRVGADFSFTNVPPGLYAIRVTSPLPAGWAIASVLTATGVDVLDTLLDVRSDHIAGLVIALTQRSTSLSGTLTTADGRPSFDQLIGVFSIDRQFWTPGSRRVRLIQPDLNGHYTVTGLPPGDYFVIAGAEKAGDIEVDPSSIGDLVADSVRVTLASGEKKVQDFRNR